MRLEFQVSEEEDWSWVISSDVNYFDGFWIIWTEWGWPEVASTQI